MIGMAIACRLQECASVTVVDDSFFPGLGETTRALGVLRRHFPEELLDSYAGETWDFALAQHRHPKSPVRLTLVAWNERAEGAAFLDHMLLLDAYLFLFRRQGGKLEVGGRVTGVEPGAGGKTVVHFAKGDEEKSLPADVIVAAPGPRLETFSLLGAPQATIDSFIPVMDVIIPFHIPSDYQERGIYTRDGYTVIAGERPGRVLVAKRVQGSWSEPSFDQLVELVDDMQSTLAIPGEALVDRVKVCRDLAGPGGLPVVGQVAPSLYVAAAMGLNGLSIAGGVAGEIARQIARRQ